MLPFTRKRLILALVFFCGAAYAMANFGLMGNVVSTFGPATQPPTLTATFTPTNTPSAIPSPFPEYDLTISQADSPDPVLFNQPLTYTLTVTNSPAALGGGACPNVRFGWPILCPFTFSSASGTNGYVATADSTGVTFSGGCVSSQGGVVGTATLTVVLIPTTVQSTAFWSLGHNVIVDPENNWHENDESNNAATTIYTTVNPGGTPLDTRTPTFTNTPTHTNTATGTVTPTATAAVCPPAFVSTVPIVINDNGAGAPYPSNIVVSGLSGTVTDVKVDLVDMAHTFPDDVDILLVGPGGENTLLMSDVGGGFDTLRTNLTFDDAVPVAMPDDTQISNGTFGPTNYDLDTDVFPAPAPAPGGPVAMGVFKGTNPKGIWSLYVRDDLGVDTGRIAAGWRLHIKTTDCGSPTGTPTSTATITPTPTAFITPSTPGGYFYVQLSAATYSAEESQTAVITINKTGHPIDTTVNISTSNGTATGGAACGTSGVDYVTGAHAVTFNFGETTKTVNVPLCSDALSEPTETIKLTLTGPGTSSPTATAVLNVIDGATPTATATFNPTVSPSPVPEYDLTISQSAPPFQFLGVDYTLTVTNSPTGNGGNACPTVRFGYPTGLPVTYLGSTGTNGFVGTADGANVTFTGGCLSSQNGQRASATLRVYFQAPGTGATLTSLGSNVVIDPENALQETDENNNTAQTVETRIFFDTVTPTPTYTASASPTPTNTATPIPSGNCDESFDFIDAPALPFNWTSTATGAEIPWVTSTISPDAGRNAAFAPDPNRVGNTELVFSNQDLYVLPGVPFSFRNNYDLEGGYDGMVLEISVNGGPFQDIIAAGGSFISGGYNGTISISFMSPIAGRQAWTGNSGGYITTAVRLPPSTFRYQLKWRVATDTSVAGTGVRIDSIMGLQCGDATPTFTATATPTRTATNTPTFTPTATATPMITASISGRVLTAGGQGIRNAKVVVTGNSLTSPIIATTGSFGYFMFDGLPAGETYVVTVNSRRYTFSTPSRVISLVDDVTDVDFVALE